MFIKKLYSLAIIVSILFANVASAQEANTKQTLHVLFLGKTGTGKSSLINIFYNHIIGNKYEDPRDIVIPLLDRDTVYNVNVEKCKQYNVQLNNNGHSQTKDVREYVAHNADYEVHLWDAPGFIDTDSQVLDEERVKRIVEAIGGVALNAIAVVMKADELDRRTPELEVSIARVRTMLPKSAAKNIIGMFNRVGSLSRDAKQNLKTDFARLLNISQGDWTPDVFTIDGRSFFDHVSPHDDEFESYKLAWEQDRTIVNRLIKEISQKKPFNGHETVELQKSFNAAEAKFEERVRNQNRFNEQTVRLSRLHEDLQVKIKQREDNRWYEKEKVVTVESKRRVVYYGPRGSAAVWVTDYKTKTIQYTDEDQKWRFLTAQNEVDTLQREIVSATHAKEECAYWVKQLWNEIVASQKKMEALAISTDYAPFIGHIEGQIRELDRNSAISRDEKERHIGSFASKLEFYKLLRSIRHTDSPQ